MIKKRPWISIGCCLACLAFLWLGNLMPQLVLAQTTFQEIDLSAAVAQGLVTADVRASGDSYYGPGTLNATLTNTGTTPLTVVIPQGLRFLSQDTTYQDEIVAITERIDLQPGETRTVPLTSFCGNAHRAAPVADNAYAIGEMEPPRMRALLSEIESQNLEDDIQGQWAVWQQTDGLPTPSRPDFSDVISFLDGLGSQGVSRQVALSAPLMDIGLLQQLAWLSLFRVLIPWLLLALLLLLLLALLWWLLSRRKPMRAPIAPPSRAGSYPEKKEKPKTKRPEGRSITHGRPMDKRGKK